MILKSLFAYTPNECRNKRIAMKPWSIVIPEQELEISTSRSGGPGGQHVNKTNSRVTVRWNIPGSQVLSEEQKGRVLEKLANEVTGEGDILVHHSSSRSQLDNKKAAIARLHEKITGALHVPKKRTKTKVSKAKKEKRLQEKSRRGEIKKMRSRRFDE